MNKAHAIDDEINLTGVGIISPIRIHGIGPIPNPKEAVKIIIEISGTHDRNGDGYWIINPIINIVKQQVIDEERNRFRLPMTSIIADATNENRIFVKPIKTVIAKTLNLIPALLKKNGA